MTVSLCDHDHIQETDKLDKIYRKAIWMNPDVCHVYEKKEQF